MTYTTPSWIVSNSIREKNFGIGSILPKITAYKHTNIVRNFISYNIGTDIDLERNELKVC